MSGIYHPTVKEVTEIIKKLEQLQAKKKEHENIKMPNITSAMDYYDLSQKDLLDGAKALDLPQDELLGHIKDIEKPYKSPFTDDQYKQLYYSHKKHDELKADFWSKNIKPLIDEIDIELSPLWPYLSLYGADELRSKNKVGRVIKTSEPDELNWVIHEFKKVKKIRETQLQQSGKDNILSVGDQRSTADDSDSWPRWLKVTEVERLTSINRGDISKAADSGKLESNGKRGRKRRICLIGLVEWLKSRNEDDKVDNIPKSIKDLMGKLPIKLK